MIKSSTPTVLVPGGGGPAAIGAIKSLRLAGFQGKIVSTDADPLSPGLYLADARYVLPPISDPRFFGEALRVIDREEIALILATSGFDILIYSQHKKELADRGVTAAISDHDAMDNCVDKWRFYQLARERFPLPSTTLDSRAGVAFPCFIKPVRGKGSRHAYLCRDRRELEEHLEERSDFIIQEYLPGDEYTIDVLSDLAGVPLVAVPRVRLATKEGISVKGRVVRHPWMEKVCLELARFLELKGPSCMQMKEDENGQLKFVEVNPRMGGGTIFSTLAGVNFAALLVEMALGRPARVPAFREMTVLRYYEEIVLTGC